MCGSPGRPFSDRTFAGDKNQHVKQARQIVWPPSRLISGILSPPAHPRFLPT
jgi:hypothetical protein